MFFFDYDLDGLLDIFAANGHLDEDIERVQPKVHFAQSPLLFHNTGNGRFEVAIDKVGADLAKPKVARGAAYADYDRDGDLDILVTTNNGPAYLYRNDGGNVGSYLRVKLAGEQSNRDGIGAIVRVRSRSGEQWRMVRSGSSYCSQSELPLTFGLASDAVVDSVQGGMAQRPAANLHQGGAQPAVRHSRARRPAGIEIESCRRMRAENTGIRRSPPHDSTP